MNPTGLHAPDAGHLMQRLALRPAAPGGELAPAPLPAPVPQAPFGTLQSANRLSGQRRVGGACAKAAGGLQHMLEAHRGVLPVEHRGHAETACLDDSVADTSIPR